MLSSNHIKNVNIALKIYSCFVSIKGLIPKEYKLLVQ